MGAFLDVRQRGAAAVPARAARTGPAPRRGRRSSARSCPASTRSRRHRAEPPRRARQGPRDPPRGRRPDARLHPLPGLRGPAAQDGREGQRRRPVLHAARGHPRDGPGRSTRRSARRSTTRAAAPAASWRRRSSTCARGLGPSATAEQLRTLREDTFCGREKENLIYPIALANLVLHGIDEPHIWHGNTLTGQEIYGGLFAGAPATFDVVLMNPPFGGKEGKEAQTHFAYKTGATQVLFLQHVIDVARSPAAAAASSSTRASCSAPTRRPSSRPSASCSTTATCGASCRCRPACSRRPAPA